MIIPPNNLGKNISGGSSGSSGAVTDKPGAVAPQAKVKDSGSSADPVSLSPEAQKLARLGQAVSQQPAADENRVEAFRQAIAKGEYSVDSQSIAKKMMDMDNRFS